MHTGEVTCTQGMSHAHRGGHMHTGEVTCTQGMCTVINKKIFIIIIFLIWNWEAKVTIIVFPGSLCCCCVVMECIYYPLNVLQVLQVTKQWF